MCGIAGIVMRAGTPPDPAVLDALERALFHRGPDMSGRHQRGGLAMLSTRLAIIGIDTGRQPLQGPPGIALVANGEIYNDPELRAAMPDVRFRTGSDCEPPAHLYARHGFDYADHLRGMYAIAIDDGPGNRLVLSRDQFGIKPLYYVETPAYFAFASEIQALLNAGLARRDVAAHRRSELLQLKFTTGRDTIIPGVMRVLPGETIAVEAGQVVARRQRPSLAAEGPTPLGHAEALRSLERVLLDSVSVHLRSEVPYGLFLSGGIDSSTLLALMQRLSAQPVQAISAGYDGAHPDESREAERLARLAGAEFHRVTMGPDDFWRLAPRIVAAIDDPTTDAAVLPTWMLGRAAREHGLKVTLCGEGADELFGGYSRYRRGIAPFRWLQSAPRSKGVFGPAPGLDVAGWRDGLAGAERHAANPAWSALQSLQAIDIDEWLPNDLLGKLDRCLMAHSVEGRTPFIDPVVGAFAFRLPDRLKIGPRRGKLLLRDWLAVNFPGARPYARKQGFKPPVGRWMAARGEELARLVAAQPGVEGIAPANVVRSVFARAAEESQPAWSLLFYALWHAHHVLGRSAEGDVKEVLG